MAETTQADIDRHIDPPDLQQSKIKEWSSVKINIGSSNQVSSVILENCQYYLVYTVIS